MGRQFFGTDGIRGKAGEFPICPEFMLKLGFAVGRVLGQSKRGKVIIGKDTRLSGYMFESALEAGLSAAGMDTILLGPMPTPAIAYLTRTQQAKAGIVISASHNHYEDNGVKFFTSNGRKLPDSVELEIEKQIEGAITLVEPDRLGRAKRMDDAPGRYIEFCKSSVPGDLDLTGLKIVVDCAHGATYHIAPKVFTELGAQVIAIGNQPDGLNINNGVGSTHPDALVKTVLDQQADFGIAFDGDGDRVMMVDHKGELVDGDELIYIIAEYRQNNNALHGPVIGTQMTNLGLELALRDKSVELIRTQVGDRYVLEGMDENRSILGGENSGHIICLDRTTTGDGIISALQVVAAMVAAEKSLHELKSGMTKFPQVLVNVRVSKRIDLSTSEPVQEAVRQVENELKDRGRVLLRYSGTEPLIRVMIEGRESGQVHELADQLANAVKSSIV